MARQERDYSHRSLIDKLGVKPSHRVCVRNAEAEFARLLEAHLGSPPASRAQGTFDVVFLKVDGPADLAAVASLAAHLKPDGALWIIHPKGRGASPHENEVRACGIEAGLVDNKVSAYSGTHTATRYVIPRAKR